MVYQSVKGVILFLVLLASLYGSNNVNAYMLKRVRGIRRNMEVKPRNVKGELISKCTEYWRNATLDHFSFVSSKGAGRHFKQRYYVCDPHWTRPNSPTGPGPIFFYTGNEADVLLYLNNTGLMWESAPDFGALLVFAEHRYYGQSQPFAPWPKGGLKPAQLNYLSSEQAMLDYVELIAELKASYGAEQSAVIAFGGSYGGMLAAWMRMKYPHVIDGAVAGSAPIWNFFGETPAYDTGSFAKGVTYDASEEAGSSKNCASNVRYFWKVLDVRGKTPDGRAFLAEQLGLCPTAPLASADDVLQLREWLADAWDNMAMGNYPYASGYIINGDGELPPFPIHAACLHLADENPDDARLITGMARAVGVYYNHSRQLPCLDWSASVNPATAVVDDLWQFQWCSEMFMPASTDGVLDMFWAEPFNVTEATAGCEADWDVTPRPYHAQNEWGGRRIEAASNIVFSNGLLDPWHGGGVLKSLSDSLVALVIPEGAHHLDLMFSHTSDPISVTEVRKTQRKLIHQWVAQAAGRSNQTTLADPLLSARKAESAPERRPDTEGGSSLASSSGLPVAGRSEELGGKNGASLRHVISATSRQHEGVAGEVAALTVVARRMLH